jgi:hypothetical protein
MESSARTLFLLKRQEDGLAWQQVICDSEKKRGHLLSEEGSVAAYMREDGVYYVNRGMGCGEIFRTILGVPWLPRDADKFRVDVSLRDASTDEYDRGTYTVDRYELAGRFGQFLKDGGRAARLAGFSAAVVDAFFWFRAFLSSCCGSGVAAFSVAYLISGLFIGMLLYGLGLLMEYLYGRWYGYTPEAKIATA